MKTLILESILFITGCATPSVYLVILNSGEVHEFRPSRTDRSSITDQVVGDIEIGDCAQQFEAMGYIKAENLTPAQRAELKPTFKYNTLHESN